MTLNLASATLQNYHWIDKQESLQKLCADAAQHSVLGLDTEFMRRDTFWPELALLQCAFGAEVNIVDPLAVATMQPMQSLLCAPLITKIMHSASEDLVALAPIAQAPVQGLFDTQIAAALIGLGTGLSYQKLVEALLNITLAKDETRSNWLRRPLSEQQKNYAADDVVHLAQIYYLLKAELEKRNRLEWCVEDCDRLCRNIAQDKAPENPHWSVPGAHRKTPDEQALLHRLLVWREVLARKHNRPRSWIFDEACAANLIQIRVSDHQDMTSLLKQQRAFPQSETKALADLLIQAIEPSELEIELAPQPQSNEDKRKADVLKQWIAQKAQALDIPAPVLFPRRLIDAVLRGKTPEELQGWRGKVLSDMPL